MDKAELLKQIQNGLQEIAIEIERVHEPYWKARNELSKNIISLSSASVVLTITFSNSLVNSRVSGNWKYLLFASWISFLLSIIAAIISLWISIQLNTFRVRFFNARDLMKEAIDKIDPESEDPYAPIESVTNKLLAPMPPYEKRAAGFLHSSLVAFMLALVLLGLFGWQQFAA